MHFNYILKAAVSLNKKKASAEQTERKKMIRILRAKKPRGVTCECASLAVYPSDIFYGSLIIDWIERKYFMALLVCSEKNKIYFSRKKRKENKHLTVIVVNQWEWNWRAMVSILSYLFSIVFSLRKELT